MSVTTASRPSVRRTARRTRTVRRSVVALPVAAALMLSACSSGGSSTPSGGGGDSSEAVTTATKLLDTAASTAVTGPSFGSVSADQIVPWTADAMPKPTALVQGKQISVDVVYGLAVGEGPYTANLVAAIATELGWKAKIIRAAGQDQPSTLAAYQQALLDKPTAIISFVVPGVWVGPALAEAKSRGIYTINVHQDDTTGPGFDAYVPNAEGIAKSLMAAYAIKDSDGKASALLLDAPGFSDANMPAAANFFKTCGGCDVVSKQQNPEVFIDPVKVQSGVQALLAANPDTGYLFWPNASLQVPSVVTAIRGSVAKNTKLVINGMAPAALDAVKKGDVPILVEAPDALLVLAALEDVNLLAQGKPAIAQDALRLPIGYWTTDDVPDAQDFSAITEAQLKNDFLAPYEQAWGVSLRDTMLGVKN